MQPQTQPVSPADRTSVERRVIEIVAHALDKPVAAVTLRSSFWTELGAESLDMLDIAFSLERAFGIRVPHTDPIARAVDRFGEESILERARITEFGVALIRRTMPEIDPAKLHAGMGPLEFRTLITVESVVRVVHRLLDYKESQLCPNCSGKMADAPSAPELQCTQCGLTQPYAPGDQILLEDLERAAKEIGWPKPPGLPASVPSPNL